MKTLHLIFFALLLPAVVFAQSCPTNGQIYNYAVGDTFEYTASESGGVVAEYEGPFMDVVSARQNFQDSIVYTMAIWSAQSGALYSETSQRQVIYNIDSPAGPIYSVGFCSNCDTTIYGYYCNSNTITINESCGSGGSSYTQTYQNGLGQTNLNWHCVLSGGNDLGYQVSLIYYHKTNEAPLGTFVLLPTGISSLTSADFQATLSPNPASAYSALRVSEVTNRPMYFKLFDAVGRLIMQKTVVVNSTPLDLQMQTRGVYFWQVESGETILRRGKLILQ